MKRFIMAVRDKAAECYGSPLFVQSKGIGIRSFTDEINRNDKNNQMYVHPEDFDLYFLGTFDDVNGQFEQGIDEPIKVATGFDVKIRE